MTIRFALMPFALLLLCLVPCKFAASQVGTSQPSTSITIQGFLYDIHGKPIVNGTVVLVPTDANRSMAVSEPTAKDGHYRLVTSRGGEPFDVLYFHSQIGTVTVSRLSADKNQSISKILYDDKQLGDKKQAEKVVFDMLQSYEHVLYLIEYSEFGLKIRGALESRDIALRQSSYDSAVEKLPDGPSSKLLRQKLEFIKSEYKFART